MADESSLDRDPVERLADEFLERRRGGQSPTVEEYVARYPELAEEIEEVFPALMIMDALDPVRLEAEAPISGRLGDYRILRRIGGGGMGVVYEAEQVSLSRRVALKVMARSITSVRNQAERFQRESRAAAHLHHSNIVPVFGVGQEDDYLFFAMQYIEGQGLDEVIGDLHALAHGVLNDKPDSAAELSAVAQSLWHGTFPRPLPGASATARYSDEERARLLEPPASARPCETHPVAVDDTQAERRPFDPDSSRTLAGFQGTYGHRVAAIGIQAAEALAYAHEHGVIHRDIKPSNMMLDLWGTLWVTDFGLAKMTEEADLTKTGELLGTLRYLAPETLAGRTDARSDILGLGLTLYELCALRPARDIQAGDGSLWQSIQQPVPPLRSIHPDVPRDLDVIIGKMIVTDPELRYQTAAEVAHDLRRFVNFEPIRARRSWWWERGARWCRRNPLAAGLLAALIVVFLSGFGTVLWKWDEATRQAAAARRAGAHAVAQRQSAERLRRQADDARANESRQRELSESNLYCTQVALAKRAWENGDMRRALELLRLTSPDPGQQDRRGWEWYYLAGLFQSHLAVMTDHASVAGSQGGVAMDIAVTRDGRRLLTVGGGNPYFRHIPPVIAGELIVRGPDGQPQRRLEGHENGVVSVQIGPDEATAVTTSWDRTAMVWNLATGERLARFGPFDRTPAAAFDPARNRLVIEIGRQLVVRDLPSGAERRIELDQPLGDHFQASPDGRHFATSVNEPLENAAARILLWDAETLRRVHAIPAHDGPIKRLVFSPQGDLLATGSADGSVRVWDVASGSRRATFWGEMGEVGAVVFSEDQKRLAAGGASGVIRQWELDSGRPLVTLEGHTAAIQSLAFMPAGGQLVSGGHDGTIRIWDLTREQRGLRAGRPMNYVVDVRFGPEAHQLAVLRSRPAMIFVWDLRTNEIVARYEFDGRGQDVWPQSDFEISPDSRWIASPAGEQSTELLLFDMAAGDAPARWPAHCAPVTAVKFTPDSRHLLTSATLLDRGQASKTELRLWSIDDHRLVWSRDLTGAAGRPAPVLRALACSASAESIAAGDGTGMGVFLWQRRGEPEPRVLDGPLGCLALAFSPDGTRLAASDAHSESVLVWHLSDGDRLDRLPAVDMVSALAYSPDGRRLAASGYSGDVKIWHAETGQEIFVLRSLAPPPDHSGMTPVVRFSPDGRRLASTNKDGTVNVWEALMTADDYRDRARAALLRADRGAAAESSPAALEPD